MEYIGSRFLKIITGKLRIKIVLNVKPNFGKRIGMKKLGKGELGTV